MAVQPLDKNEWYRVGRGRYREYATVSPGDVGAIVDALPAEYAPYLVVSSEMVKVAERKYKDVCDIVSIHEVQDIFDRGVWNFLIVSQVLSEWIYDYSARIDSDVLVVNGAIDIQFRVAGRYGRDKTTVIGHTADVCSEKTGEHVHFAEYSKVFESAIRAAARLERVRR